jgi:Fe-S-cluster formation regulator IscX/YfhJ
MSAESEDAGAEDVDPQTVRDLVRLVNSLQDENDHLKRRVEKLEDEVGVGGDRF